MSQFALLQREWTAVYDVGKERATSLRVFGNR
jgi:hypothetical protein